MILFTGGVCLSACWDTTPQTRHPPGPGTLLPSRDQAHTPWEQAPTPLEQATPPAQSMLGDMVNAWVVCILCSQGVCLSACWDTTPQTRHPPRTRHPPPPPPPPGTMHTPPGSRHPPPWSRQPPPPAQSMLGDMVNARVVCILLECNLVHFIFSFYKRACQKIKLLRCLMKYYTCNFYRIFMKERTENT